MTPSALLTVLAAMTFLSCAPAEGAPAAGQGGEHPVLVELFTSQGCSSCPPADRLMRKLSSDPEIQGRLISLSFHVDYWNYLGWSDPFSSSVWSERQRQYSDKVGVDVYTPQAVVNGRVALVGSSEKAVRHAILDESRRAPLVRLSVGEARFENGRLLVDIEASRDAEVWIAVAESGLSTEVRSGENGGRRLENDRVVRWLQRVDLEADSHRGRVEVELGRGWRPDALTVVAFAQDPKSMEITGVATN